MAKRFRVCVVGGGDIGNSHLRGWARVPDAEVVALVEPIPERREETGARFAVPNRYADYQEAVTRDDVNVVSVCTPACYHAEVTCAALRAGKDVICVKPIAVSDEDAGRMIDAARRESRTLAIGFNTRLRWEKQGLASRFREGAVGRPVVFTRTIFQQVRFKLMMQERHGNGGPFIDIGVHAFDLWLDLFQSQATRVTARARTFARYQPEAASVREFAPDTGTAVVEFASGDLGVFNVSWGMPRGVDLLDDSEDVVIGPAGYLKLDFRWDARLARRGEPVVEIPRIESHPIEDDVVDFAARLRDGRPPFADGADGRRALRVALAALESIETGKTIDLR